MMYKVLKPIYTVVGKVLIKNRNVDLYDISWEKVGTAKGMRDAKRKYGHIVKHPALEPIVH